MRVLLLNGPNLNLLGTRRPEVYGTTTLDDLETLVRGWAADLGVTHVQAYQSNHEGHLIDRLHAARGGVDGIVFNPGAFTHTSYALHDAIEAVEIPTVETHISDVESREPWRRRSVVRPACVHTVYGRGVESYRWALRHLVARARRPVERLRYADGAEQFVDLRFPDGSGPWPLAVLVHGGFWRHQWTSDTTELSALDLVDRGVACANVEYRRVGEAGGGGGGRASVEDVAAAVRFALEDPRVDAARWSIAGHSAGGQLALAAVASLRDVVAPPALAVSMAGCVDLEAAIAEGVGDGAAAAYVGEEDPAALSPVRLVPLGVPLTAVHGRLDESVPPGQSDSLVRAATAAGDDIDLVEFPDGHHFEFLDPAEPMWQAVAERLVAGVRPGG
ncbi:type II 3-dehydroquinate dehydratase [Euzebya sp.]|uniref:type II 3-dehydroquinate dehydratase n=1 Tax=Euzebya sp. TaxID=1971409 RepID=UPI003517F3B0